MRRIAEVVAVLACSLFPGAALYVTLVEHPARMSCGVDIAATEFPPSYRRATIRQATPAALGLLASGLSFLSPVSLCASVVNSVAVKAFPPIPLKCANNFPSTATAPANPTSSHPHLAPSLHSSWRSLTARGDPSPSHPRVPPMRVCGRIARTDEPRSPPDLETSAMKTILLLSCLLFASLTWGQAASSMINGQPQPLRQPSHPEHASQASMSHEESLLGAGAYTSAKGERPLWEVAPPTNPTPLGDVARTLKKQHETAKKATFIREN